MHLTSSTVAPVTAAVDAIVLPMTEAMAKELPAELQRFDRTLGGLLTTALRIGNFRGEEHTTFTVLTNGTIPAPRVLLVGMGTSRDRSLLEWQHVVGTSARMLQQAKVTRWTLVLPRAFTRAFRPDDLGRMTAKGVLVSTYHFARYKSDPATKFLMPEEIVVGPLSAAARRRFDVGAREGTIVGSAMNWMRDFGNMPSSDATPTFLADRARELAKVDRRFRLTVLDRAAMEREGMGAILGVARGAVTPPVCIILEWRGDPRSRRPKAWRAFVGKGITFDSGGISLKPGEKMDEMKFDMSGGAAVLGALRAVGALGLRVNVVGIIPATDNLPSGTAYKPGDILRTCRGKTLEVLNTDAEGRLVLADGIGSAIRMYDPVAIVDVATLTGAIVVALGAHFTGCFANDHRLFQGVRAAAETSGDRIWHMPLGDAYTREVRSDIADLQNVGKKGREGGACTAAAFLEACAEGRPWAHLDIAGTAWGEATPWCTRGATGVGVHLLVELAKGWARR